MAVQNRGPQDLNWNDTFHVEGSPIKDFHDVPATQKVIQKMLSGGTPNIVEFVGHLLAMHLKTLFLVGKIEVSCLNPIEILLFGNME